MPATTLHRLFLCALTLFVGGCAGGFAPPPPPSPDAIPDLEERLLDSPDNAEVLWRLGAAHRAAGDLDRARSHLERAVEAAPEDPSARLYLALTYEDQEAPSEAIAAYQAYIGLVPESSLEGEIAARIQLLRRQELRQAVRDAVSREAELAGTRPDARAVAVFPFLFAAEDAELRPLGRALAQMLATDLGQTDRVRVVERLQIQALLDEVALAATGAVDPATAARSGYLIGAGQIVQGQIQGSQEDLRLDAAILTVQDPRSANRRPVGVSDEVEQLFDLEKRLAFEIFDAMGVELTPTERERVNHRHTENLQAVLAYGMGLEAADRGEFDEAAEHFAQAAALDPGFAVAVQEAQEAQSLAQAAETSTGELAESEAVEEVASAEELTVPEVLDRNPAAELLGTEQLGGSATIIEVIIVAPGGDV